MNAILYPYGDLTVTSCGDSEFITNKTSCTFLQVSEMNIIKWTILGLLYCASCMGALKDGFATPDLLDLVRTIEKCYYHVLKLKKSYARRSYVLSAMTELMPKDDSGATSKATLKSEKKIGTPSITDRQSEFYDMDTNDLMALLAEADITRISLQRAFELDYSQVLRIQASIERHGVSLYKFEEQDRVSLSAGPNKRETIFRPMLEQLAKVHAHLYEYSSVEDWESLRLSLFKTLYPSFVKPDSFSYAMDTHYSQTKSMAMMLMPRNLFLELTILATFLLDQILDPTIPRLYLPVEKRPVFTKEKLVSIMERFIHIHSVMDPLTLNGGYAGAIEQFRKNVINHYVTATATKRSSTRDARITVWELDPQKLTDHIALNVRSSIVSWIASLCGIIGPLPYYLKIANIFGSRSSAWTATKKIDAAKYIIRSEMLLPPKIERTSRSSTSSGDQEPEDPRRTRINEKLALLQAHVLDFELELQAISSDSRTVSPFAMGTSYSFTYLETFLKFVHNVITQEVQKSLFICRRSLPRKYVEFCDSKFISSKTEPSSRPAKEELALKQFKQLRSQSMYIYYIYSVLPKEFLDLVQDPLSNAWRLAFRPYQPSSTGIPFSFPQIFFDDGHDILALFSATYEAHSPYYVPIEWPSPARGSSW